MIDHFTEFVHVLKASVDRGKSDISHMIQAREFGHNAFANEAGGDFALTRPKKFLLNSGDRRLDSLDIDRTFFKGPQHSRSKLVFPKGFPVSVAFDDAG
jgi:hypothetical protein